ncbi:MAG: sulfite exporter TauE/SafE family protein [bacterium]
MNYWIIFFTGLTSGGVTCAAMQGGLLAGIIANQKRDETAKKLKSAKINSFDLADWGPVTAFLSTKLVSHIILGALLGLLGSRIELSLPIRLFFQTLAAIFMFATAMNLLDVHPIFRRLAFQPPKSIYKLIKKSSGSTSLFAPALFGLFTILIPCGVTQAMEVLAITSGSAIQGALIMGAFVLGTAPMFAIVGIATAKFSEFWRVHFLRTAAVLLIGMALYSVNGTLQVLDSPFSLQRLGPKLVKLLPPYSSSSQTRKVVNDPNVKLENGVQKITISVSNHGYSPTHFQVSKDVPVELTLKTEGGVYSCATAFTFRAFNISDLLKPNESKVHTFTPTKKGIYTFSCSMGMYSGTMEVI